MHRTPLLRSFLVFLTVLCLLSDLPPVSLSATAEETREAEEITRLCTIVPATGKKNFKKCLDNSYKTYWRSGGGKGAVITVTVPEGQFASGVWFQWYDHPHAAALQVQDENGVWTECDHSDGLYLSDYLELPELTTHFRIANASGVSSPFPLAELHIFGAGTRSRKAQVWEPPAEKADLMIVVAHPDDEVLWMGGMMPTYAGEQGKSCQVCMMVPTLPRRRLELLDCLWTCGVRNYPVWGRFRDTFSYSLTKQYKSWGKNNVWKLITGWIRRFRPDVLVTHDFGGEYGHGAHRVCADAVSHCLSAAANEKKYTDSAKEYGTWDVPKCYIHLYSENVIDLDWRIPLEAFDGKTSFEVAEEGFRCHISQQNTDYHVEDSGPWDNSLFGLYRSLVGEDVQKNDLFENLE